MLKKIIIFILCNFYIGVFSTFAGNLSDIFLDIEEDYIYYQELRELYEKGIVSPDDKGNFNPLQLLQRDEFFGMISKTNCSRCIQPDIEYSLVQDYFDTQIFTDLEKTNPYFYCIADLKNFGFIQGCNPESQLLCSEENISKDEAIAFILRLSGIYSAEKNKQTLLAIAAGEIFPDLASDLKPLNPNGTPYAFYGYMKKALEYEIKSIDKNGEESVYHFLTIKDNKIRPKSYISKQDFLYLAYVSMIQNPCNITTENALSLNINIFDKSCDSEQSSCFFSPLSAGEKIFDFTSNIDGVCEDGIDEDSGYFWRFYNFDTQEEITQTGSYLDNFELSSEGKYRVVLRAEDACQNASEVYHTLDTKGLSVSIQSDNNIGPTPLDVDFSANASQENLFYEWSIGTNEKFYSKNIEHIFSLPGTFTIELNVENSSGQKASATSIVTALEEINCEGDADDDTINDCEDLCPLISGDSLNDGCPILDNFCKSDCSCDSGYSCNTDDADICSGGGVGVGVCVPTQPNEGCSYSSDKNYIFGNASCSTCPCDNFLDFNADIRECDIIFPAITSLDYKEIYSKGSFWEIK